MITFLRADSLGKDPQIKLMCCYKQLLFPIFPHAYSLQITYSSLEYLILKIQSILNVLPNFYNCIIMLNWLNTMASKVCATKTLMVGKLSPTFTSFCLPCLLSSRA